MKPQIGNYIKIYFKNGFVEEGVVDVWNESEMILSNSDSFIIINNSDDIILIKIYKDIPSVISNNKQTVYVEPKTLPTYEPDPKLRALKLADLHKLRKVEESANVRRALTEFKPTDSNTSNHYGTPGLGRREKSIFISPTKKD